LKQTANQAAHIPVGDHQKNLGGEYKKKDPYPRHGYLDKGLVDRIAAPVPGLSTVLTETGLAISLADNYSPLA